MKKSDFDPISEASAAHDDAVDARERRKKAKTEKSVPRVNRCAHCDAISPRSSYTTHERNASTYITAEFIKVRHPDRVHDKTPSVFFLFSFFHLILRVHPRGNDSNQSSKFGDDRTVTTGKRLPLPCSISHVRNFRRPESKLFKNVFFPRRQMAPDHFPGAEGDTAKCWLICHPAIGMRGRHDTAAQSDRERKRRGQPAL